MKSAVAVRIVGRLSLVIVFAGQVYAADAPAAQAPAADSRYQRLLAKVIDGEPVLRRRFAEVALRALIAANRTEIDRDAARGALGGGWRAGAAQYVAGLEGVYARLETYRDIRVVREREGVVRLAFDGTQVMLSSPRLSGQQQLDAGIAGEMCQQVDCGEAPSALAESVAHQARNIRHEWAFSDRAPPVLSASDGLNCTFDGTRHLRLKERSCAGVMHELRLVAEGLRAVVQHGGSLDWQAFAIEVADDSRTRIVYGGDGAYFNLDVRYLVHAPAIWREAVPWLQAGLRGYAGYYMIRLPEHLAYLESE